MNIVIGHKNPDTDSIVSALAYADFKNKKEGKFVACAAGKLNNETQFVLKFLKVKPPKAINNIGEKDVVILLDHCEASQAIEGLEKAKIIEVIDHHKLSGLSTGDPILYRAEPVGSTATIIAKIFKENEFKLNKQQAGLLLCGIVSDTLKFTSPTTTDTDKKIAKDLEKISKIKINDLAEKMFEAKSDISKMSLDEIVNADYKIFEEKNTKLGFGVYETTNPKVFDSKKENLVGLLTNRKSKENLNLIFFAVVDIIEQKSFLYLIGDSEKNIAQKAFGGKIDQNIMVLDKIVSRKKQMIPPIIGVI